VNFLLHLQGLCFEGYCGGWRRRKNGRRREGGREERAKWKGD